MRILICRITDIGVMLRSRNLIAELLKMGHEVIVATPRETAYQDIIGLGCKFIEIKIDGHGMNPIKDYSVYRQYKRILKTEKPDLALLYTTKPNVYCGACCRKGKIPVVMNITGMGMALGNKGFAQHILIKLYKFACNGKNVKKVFFQNDESMVFFKNRRIGNSEVFERIPGSGVDLDKYRVQDFPSSETVDFLFVARVMKQKGIDQYLEAAKRIRKSHPETRFHVLGGCDESYQSVMEEETKAGTIIYHGRVSNIIDYQKMSQCTIQPSYYPEGMSNVILEAAACGRPVITTDHPGCREGVDDGVTGYIVPVKNSDMLTKTIEKFLSLTIEERTEMGLCGRKKMENEFDIRLVMSAYLKAICS